MIKAIQKRREDQDRGFTLIELMVVVLIIAILIAVAIPTFLGARKRAQDRAAQSNLRNALTAEKVYYADHQKYTMDESVLSGLETSLRWNRDDWPNGAIYTVVGDTVVGGDQNTVCLLTRSASGADFAIRDIGAGPYIGTYYSRGWFGCYNSGVDGQWNAKW